MQSGKTWLFDNVLLFQSSPGQKAGCNTGPDSDKAINHAVSILTRPEGRMQ